MGKILEATRAHKIIAILRGIDTRDIGWVIDALYAGGIRLLEVTFNQKSDTKIEDTVKAIRYVKEKYQNKMCVGAGTVMSIRELTAAHEVGAEFILSPNVDLTVIKEALKLGVAAIPGAMTPTEIIDAYEAGAEMVKLFPAGNLGLSYCKAIMAPINHVPLIAVGGIDADNLSAFLQAGFMGAGIGSNLIDKVMINNHDYNGICQLALLYTEAAKK